MATLWLLGAPDQQRATDVKPRKLRSGHRLMMLPLSLADVPLSHLGAEGIPCCCVCYCLSSVNCLVVHYCFLLSSCLLLLFVCLVVYCYCCFNYCFLFLKY